VTNVLLSVDSVSAGYGRESIIVDCSLEIPDGGMVGIVGRNGAGKTTLVSAISGRLPTSTGRVLLDNSRIDTLPAHRRSNLGISHVPQGREVFASLTVAENLRVATRGGDENFVFQLFPRLAERRTQKAGTLSGGEQQMLAIARAILSKPRLIILDEPSLGLAPLVVERLFASIEQLRRETQVAMLLVEQQTRWMWESGLLDLVYVLEQGRIVGSGHPSAMSEADVASTYLGQGGLAT